MGSAPETPAPVPAVDRRWLWGLRVFVLGSFVLFCFLVVELVQLLGEPYSAFGHIPRAVRGALVVALSLALLPYLEVLWRVRRAKTEKLSSILTGAGLATGWPWPMFFLGLLLPNLLNGGLLSFREVSWVGWVWILAQLGVLVCAVKVSTTCRVDSGQKKSFQRGLRRVAGYFALMFVSFVATVMVLPPEGNRMGSPPSVAAGNLRTMNSALMTYYSTYNNRFPASLEALAPAPGGESDNCDRAGMLDPDLAVASPQKHGYNYYYQPKGERLSEPGSGCSQAGYLGYTLSARPLRYRPGWRSFLTDETGAIRWTDEDRAATADDTPL